MNKKKFFRVKNQKFLDYNLNSATQESDRFSASCAAHDVPLQSFLSKFFLLNKVIKF